jgi:hypothetical protein
MNTGNLYASTQFGKTPDIICLLLWKVVTSASRCCVFRQLPHPGIACPTGKSPCVALLARGWTSKNAMRVGTKFLSRFKAIPPVQSPSEKYSAGFVGQIESKTPAILSHQRGVGHRRKRGAGSGGRDGCD